MQFSHWSNLEHIIPVSKKTELNGFVADMKKRKNEAESVTLSKDIDWNKYAAAIGSDEVAAIKAEYEAQTYSDFTAKASETKAELASTLSTMKSELVQTQESMSQYMADAEAQRDTVRSTYTTERTTLDAVLQRHPELDAKYEASLADNDYDTDDVESLDVAAKRAALLEERWDSKLMGSMTEGNLKEVLDEIDHVANKAAGGSDSSVYACAADVPAEVRARLDEAAAENGLKPLDDAAIEEWLEICRGTLTATEMAATDEPTLLNMMDHYAALDLWPKVDSVKKLYDKAQAAGTLVIDEDWRDRRRAIAAAEPVHDCLGDFDPSELDGLSEDEVMALALEAGEKKEYYRGSQILLAHSLATGKNDGSLDPSTESGYINYLDKLGKKMFS